MNELKTYLKPLINNIAQLVTRYIKNWADITEIKGCGSLQTLCRLDSNLLRIAQLFIYRNRWHTFKKLTIFEKPPYDY